MLAHHPWHPARIAGILFLVLAAACAERSSDPIGPADPAGPGLAKGGPNQPPTSSGRIFFGSELTGSSELYSVNPDGTDLRRLTFNTDTERWPSVSPDGKKVAYVKIVPPGDQAIWLMNPDGSRPRMLITPPEGATSFEGMSWAPDGRTIAFGYHTIGSDLSHIGTVDARSGAVVLLGVVGRNPSWSPDGEYLAYLKTVNGTDQLFTSRPDGSDLHQWTTDIDGFGTPQWSPDGRRILFFSQSGLAFRVLNMDGDYVEYPSATALHAGWSPDGTKIVYNDFVANGIYVMHANLTAPVMILQGVSVYFGVSWSR